MTLWIITIKLEDNPKHDPQNKKHGKCPHNLEECTDITGRHHSFIYNGEGRSILDVKAKLSSLYHVTRVEKA